MSPILLSNPRKGSCMTVQTVCTVNVDVDGENLIVVRNTKP